MSDTETVTLNLDGTFASEAKRSADSADELAVALAKVEAFDGKRYAALKQQESVLKQMKDAADAPRKSFEGSDAAIAKLNASMTEGEQTLAAMGAEAGVLGVALGAGVAAAHHFYEEMKAAYQATVAFMEEWGGFGAKMAIEETGKADLQRQIFAKLGGDYDVAVQLGLKYGIGDKSVSEFKELLQAKFSKDEVPVLIKVAASMDAVKEGSGEGFLKELEKLKLEPKVKSSDIDKLYRVGIDSKDVYKDLAKTLGTDVPGAMAKVKAGAVDSETAIKAIERAAEKSTKGISAALEDNVLVMLARVKGDLTHMFDKVDAKSIKGALKNVITEIEGSAGAEVKAAIGDLFGSAFGVAFDDFAGGKGKGAVEETMHAIAQGMREAAAEVRKLKPDVEELLAMFRKAMHDGTIDALVKAGKIAAQKKIADTEHEAKEVQGKARLVSDPEGELKKAQQSGARGASFAPGETEEGPSNTPGGGAAKALGDAEDQQLDKLAEMQESLNAASMDAGDAVDAGMAEGIGAGESEAIEAAEQMAEKALQAAKDKLGVASPSEEFGDVGGYSAEGYANRLASHPGPAAAGKKMAQSALAGAKGASGAAGALSAGAAGAGASASGGDININITIKVEGSGTVAEQWQAFQPVVEAAVRRAARDGREGARP